MQLSELCGRGVIEEAASTLSALGEDLQLELAPFLLFMGYARTMHACCDFRSGLERAPR